MTRLSTLRLNADEAIGSGGVDVYTTLDSLPSTGITTGDQAWIESDGRLYISNGSGWYNVALVNATPSLSLDQSGTITMNADTLTVTVVASATDSDDNQDMISFSVESDGNMLATGVTVSQDSSVFTITSLTEDSGGVAGDFTLTFKATDGIAVDNEDLSFTLSFSNVVDSSAETMLLMKATGNNATNAAITFLDSDGSAGVGYNENGDPQATTFSPYRSGGYSAYFDGDDYIQFAADNDWGFSTSAWTIEFWYNSTDQASHDVISAFGTSSPFPGWGVNVSTSGYVTMFFSDGSGNDGFDTVSGTTAIDDGEWHHVVVTAPASSTTVSCYVDGTLAGSHTFTETASATGQVLRVGADTNTSPARYMEGYLRDVRIVVGSQVYTSAFTPPTEALTAITNTKLLCCHLPYFGEGSEQRTITFAGDPETLPFGPYDYEPWNDSDHGGSVNFDGSDSLKIDGSPTWAQFGTGNFTIECWIRREAGDGDYAAATGILNTHRAGVSSGWYFGGSSSNRIVFWAGTNRYSSNNALRPGEWTHIAAVREGTGSNQFKLYSNGKVVGTFTENNNISSYTYGPWIGSYDTGGTTWYHTGNIADMRISNSAVYTSEFTPPTAPLSATANTVHLMNNKSGANVYDLAAANSLELVNDTKSSTTQRKFSTSSAIYFDGGDDRLQVRDFALAGDLTVEGWFYQTATQSTSYRCLVGTSTYTGSTPFGLFTYNTEVQLWGIQNGVQITGSFTANTWHHVAVVRNSGTWTLYIDGTSQGTNTNNGTYAFANTTDWQWGCGPVSLTANDFTGYMQDWRISDRAVYTANFTAPTAEFEL